MLAIKNKLKKIKSLKILYTFIKKRILKYFLNKIHFLFRFGTLPDYIIIGTQKGGTTSLQKYLTEHPDISKPIKKEVHYFDNNYNFKLKWYKKHFPTFKKIVGEASPYYIYHPLVPKRIKKNIPNVKIIILLRNPVDRAFSHYKMQYNKGLEKRTFKDAISNEKKELKDEIKKVEEGLYSFKHQNYSYIDRGKYYNQLINWLQYFDKKDILIIKSEDFYNNTQKEVSRIFNFLNLKDYKVNAEKKHNVGKYNIKLDEKIKRDLNKLYQPYNEKLYKLLNNNFNWK